MMCDADNIFIPAAAGIDYTDVNEVYGYQLLLGKIFERAGGLDYTSANNATTREVRKQGLIWLWEVKQLITGILTGEIAPDGRRLPDLAAIPDLVHAYDFMYRMCNNAPCLDFIREVKLKTADRWIKGDKSISETEIALLLLSEADRDIRSLDKRYADYALNVEDSWIDELVRYGRFIDTPMSEAYSRLTYILKSDLFVYFGSEESQDTAKKAWTKTYAQQAPTALGTRKSLNTLAALDAHTSFVTNTSLDAHTLLRYINFLLTANQFGYYNSEPEDELYSRLWTEYISRPEVHPYFRQALEIDLANLALA